MYKNQSTNGCSYSDPFIFPNLKKLSAKDAMTKEWYIGCKFFDPTQIDKYPDGYFWRRKGFASFKDFKERSGAAELAMEEMLMSLEGGYNPIIKKFFTDDDNEFSGNLFFLEALELAFEDHKVNISHHYAKCIKSDLRTIRATTMQLGFDLIRIKDIELRHVKRILDKSNLSANSYNSYRKHLSSLFKILCANSCLVQNPCENIPKKQHVKREREILGKKEFIKVYSYLKKHRPGYANYCKIFHMSGCRSTELLAVKKSDVNLEKQEFTILVKKRKIYTKEVRPIVKMAIPFWTNQIEQCKSANDYLFGVAFEPEHRDKPIDMGTPGKYWTKYVQKQFNTSVTFYALKHMFLTMIETSYGIKAAQTMAGHLNSKTTEIYTLFKKRNEIEELKKLDFTPKWVQTSELLELSPEQCN